MKIGFFDSGLGGLTILKEAINKLNAKYIYVGDILNSPYGIKSKEEVKKYTFKNIKYLIDEGCKVIVIACNTATSICINDLRNMYKDICFIGTEPAIKPAISSSDHKKVLVMATSLTLKEEKLQNLINRLDAKNETALLPMDKLVRFAEDGEKINYNLADKYIKEKFLNVNFEDFSSIVLGCTHFPLFREEFKKYIPKDIQIIDSASGVVNNMISHVNENKYLEENLDITIVLTKENKYFLSKACDILDIQNERINYKINNNL